MSRAEVLLAVALAPFACIIQGCADSGNFLAPSKGDGISITNDVSGNTVLDCFEVHGTVKCTTGLPEAADDTSEAASNNSSTGAVRLLTASCQGEGDFCTPGYECCGGLTCQHVVGGYSQQCQPPLCAQAGSTLEEGQECCSGSMRYEANGGEWCKALPPSCAQAGSTLEEGQECCSGSMRYEANGGAWCKAQSLQPPNGFMLTWSPNPNFCMSVQHNTFQNGQRVQLWHCHDSITGQHFQFADAASGSLIQPSVAPGFCVVVSSNKDKDGAKVQLWQCDSSILAQQWIRNGGTLRNAAYPDMCLVVNGNRGYNGNELQLWSCDGDDEYKEWSTAR